MGDDASRPPGADALPLSHPSVTVLASKPAGEPRHPPCLGGREKGHDLEGMAEVGAESVLMLARDQLTLHKPRVGKRTNRFAETLRFAAILRLA